MQHQLGGSVGRIPLPLSSPRQYGSSHQESMAVCQGWGGASRRWGLSGLSESPSHYGVLIFLFTSQLSSRGSKKSIIVIEGPRTGCPCLHGYQACLFFSMGAHVHSISSVLAGIFLFYWPFKTSSAGAINFILSPLSNVSISAFIFSHPFFHLPEAGVAL